MEELEARVRALPDIRLRVHRLGGIEFVQGGRELGHLHGNGLLDVRLTRTTAEDLVNRGIVRAHHVFPPRSGWVSFQLKSSDDVLLALEILTRTPPEDG